MKIYIAGRYSRRDEFREVAKQLIAMGHEVTSRWLQEDEPLQSHMGDHTPEWYAHTALIDLADINEAAAVLFFAEDPKVGTPRGGRHVEFGYALAKGKFIFVIGPEENVFHYGDPFIKNIPNVEYLAPVQVVGF
jgi:nucleoside 2-deoxyribosyltransferase